MLENITIEKISEDEWRLSYTVFAPSVADAGQLERTVKANVFGMLATTKEFCEEALVEELLISSLLTPIEYVDFLKSKTTAGYDLSHVPDFLKDGAKHKLYSNCLAPYTKLFQSVADKFTSRESK